MYIAYSAFAKNKNRKRKSRNRRNEKLALRYKAYQAVCNKYSHEIADIQKYFPGWAPTFNCNN